LQEYRKGYLAAKEDSHKVPSLNMAVAFNKNISLEMT